MMQDARFSGPEFSAGDTFIAACADGGPTGNLESWVKVALSHHLTFVARQVANLAEP